MKTLMVVIFSIAAFASHAQKKNLIETLPGAWQYEHGDTIESLIIVGKSFSEAVYNLKNKQFYYTAGGSWSIQNSHFRKMYEFHSGKAELVGQKESFYLHDENQGKLGVVQESTQAKKEFSRVDDGTPGKLAGAWLITGRMQDNGMQSITPGARRTMKILSGKRFQWIAFNSETKEFLGTGGGTYTTNDGKYVENLEFFSRDNSRVGNSLTFDFEIKDGAWHHKGLSSKGDPINEIWSRRDKVGL